jgi:hypothetical protein
MQIGVLGSADTYKYGTCWTFISLHFMAQDQILNTIKAHHSMSLVFNMICLKALRICLTSGQSF